MFPTNGLPPGNLPQVANGNSAAAVDPESMLQQIRDLAVCVDEITTRTALNSLTTVLEAATADDIDVTRATDAATQMADGAKVLEAHIRRLLAAAASI